jgi:hypothetical protein
MIQVMKTFLHKDKILIMEDDQLKNKLNLQYLKWFKNPYVLAGGIIAIVIVLYFLLPLMKGIESPFTQYKPLPIDSTYIVLDTAAENSSENSFEVIDTILSKPNSIEEEDKITTSDSSSVPSLFKINTEYDQLDPNQQLGKKKEEDQDDLFSKLIMADLSPEVAENIKEIELDFSINGIIKILSNTAVEILDGNVRQYHFDILEAIEHSSSVQGILISDKSHKVVYATNRKFININLSEVFPGRSMVSEKLNIIDIDNSQWITMPVYHQYGRIGTMLVSVEN